MDYLSFWGLRRLPFSESQDTFFAGIPQRETLAGLHYFVASSWNSAFLVSEIGNGTSTLMAHIKGMNGFGDCATEVVLTSTTGSDRTEVAKSLSDAMGLDPRVKDPRVKDPRVKDPRVKDPRGDALVGPIGEAIDASVRQGIRTIWLIDRCQPAAAELAGDLVMAHQGLSVVIGTTPSQKVFLAQKFGRLGMQIELESLSLEDTESYVRHELEFSGISGQPFADSSIVRMHELAEGRIKPLASLAAAAMQLAANMRTKKIDSPLIESVQERLAA